MSTVAERNAAFNAVHKDILELISNFVPVFFQGQARHKLDEPQGRAALLKMIDIALNAAEKARSQQEETPHG